MHNTAEQAALLTAFAVCLTTSVEFMRYVPLGRSNGLLEVCAAMMAACSAACSSVIPVPVAPKSVRARCVSVLAAVAVAV
eukprot:COSAG05_NODE_1036_length_6076_cov_159.776476_3_plen_80_part_00